MLVEEVACKLIYIIYAFVILCFCCLKQKLLPVSAGAKWVRISFVFIVISPIVVSSFIGYTLITAAFSLMAVVVLLFNCRS